MTTARRSGTLMGTLGGGLACPVGRPAQRVERPQGLDAAAADPWVEAQVLRVRGLAGNVHAGDHLPAADWRRGHQAQPAASPRQRLLDLIERSAEMPLHCRAE